jgi:RHS repeat-associated protein
MRLPHIDFSSPLEAAGSILSAAPKLLIEGLYSVFGLFRGGASASAAEPSSSPSASPAEPVELVSLRTRDSKTYLNPDGTYTAEFGKLLHYQAAPAEWNDVDLSFRADGADQVADRNEVTVRVTDRGIEVAERATGKGIRWLTPTRAAVSGRTARLSTQGLEWVYTNRKSGLKLSATVSAHLGRRAFAFPYELVGGAEALEVQSGGDLVSDTFVLPRAMVLGADGSSYQVGWWRLLPGARAAFDLDDSALPDAAFPYELDPTTVFNLASSGDDGHVAKGGSSYPPSLAPSPTTVVDATGNQLATVRDYCSPSCTLTGQPYQVSNALARWDTSSLPDTAVVGRATLRVQIVDVRADDGRSVIIDGRGATWPIDAADYDEAAPTDLNHTIVRPLASLTSGLTDLPFPTEEVSGTSYTELRTYIDGGQPTGRNSVSWASFDDPTLPEPRLIASYSTTVPSISSVSSSPSAARLGDLVTWSVGWNDPGDRVQALICKTNAVSAGTCPGGAWAIGHLSTTTPAVVSRRIAPVDMERSNVLNTYYAFVCDESGTCSSASLTGTFGVDSIPGLITLVQETSGGKGASGTSFSINWPSPPKNRNLMVAGVSVRWQASPSTITISGFSLAKKQDNGSVSAAILYGKAGASEPQTITVTTGATATEMLVSLAEYVGQADEPLERTASTSGEGTTADSGTTAADSVGPDSELYVAVLGNAQAADQIAATNGFGLISRPQTAQAGQGLYARLTNASGAASTSASLAASVPWAGVVATFEAFATSSLAAPAPTSPSVGAIVGSFAPTLSVSGGASQYRFHVTVGERVVASSGWQSGTSWQVPISALAGGGDYSWYAVAKSGSTVSVPSDPRTFTDDAQRLGVRDYYPMVSMSLGHGVGAAVNAANGNLVVSQTDVSLPTLADPFVIARTYNSRGAGKPVYIEDAVPDGALTAGTWTWDTSRKWSGTQSHKEATASGIHQHWFENAQPRMIVPPGATIATYVYLDSASTPQEVMLSFKASDGWDHRAYWGSDLIDWGVPDAASRKPMGSLPVSGSWARLEVPASAVGLEGQAVTGMAFTLYGGQAWFDKTELWTGAFGPGWADASNIVFSDVPYSRVSELARDKILIALDALGGAHFFKATGTTGEYSSAADVAKVTKNTQTGEWDLRTADRMHFYFDSTTGRLKRVTFPERSDGVGFSYTYSGNRLTAIQDPIGRQLSFAYDSTGRLQTMKADFDTGAPGGRVVATYAYNSNGELASVTDAAGHQTAYAYDAATHDLLSVTTPRGTETGTAGDFRTSFVYQSRLAGEEYRRVSEIRRPHNDGSGTTDLITSFSYTPASNTTKVTSPRGTATTGDPNDFVTTYEYNAQGNPTKVTDAAGNFSTMVWNSKNLRTSRTDAEGKTTSWDYDANGNICKQTLAVNNIGNQPATTQYFYDEFVSGFTYSCSPATKPTYNLVTRVIDAEGAVTKTEYRDPVNGKPWVTKEIAGYGSSVETQTTYTYYENATEPWRYSKIQTKRMPKGNAAGCDTTCQASYTTSYDYWGPSDTYSFPGEISLQNVPQQGWLKLASKPGDTPIPCSGTAATECHHYDFRGNELHTLSAKGDGYSVFDLDNRAIKIESLGTTGSPDPAKYVQVTFDSDGNRTRVQDPDISGDATAFAYDDLNRMTSATDAWGTTTTYAYDVDSNVTSETTPGIGTTSYTYDGLDRLATLTDPQGQATTYASYDKEGRLLEKRLPNTTHIDYVYDAAGRLTSVRNRKGASHQALEYALADASYTYDGTGQRLTEKLPTSLSSSGSASGTVDAAGAPPSQSWTVPATAQGPLTANLSWSSITKTYSFAAQPIGAAPPAGTTTTTHTINASAPGPINATLDWTDLTVNLDLKLYNPSGTLVAQATSVTNKPETLSYTVPSGSTGSYTLQVINNSLVGTTYTLSGDYKAYGNLDLELYDPSGSKVAQSTNTTGNTESLSYQVPASVTGNYSLKVLGVADSAAYSLSYGYSTVNTRTYTYDPVGRLTDASEFGTARHYDFDLNSNRTALKVNGATNTTYTYNALDRLTNLSAPAGTESFTYDSAGELVTHTRPGYVLRSDSGSGSVDVAGTATQSLTFSATAGGPVNAALDWSSTTRPYSYSDTIAAKPVGGTSIKNHTIEASSPGTISASLDWADALVNLDLRLYNPSGALVAQATSLTAKPETLSYTVPSGSTGSYRLEITNESPLLTSYTLSGSSQVYANLDLELYDPASAKVAEAKTTGAVHPETLAYTIPSGSTGTFTLKVIAATDNAAYTLSFSFPVQNVRSYTYDADGLPVAEDTNASKETFTLDGLGRVIRRAETTWKGATTTDRKYGYGGSGDSRIKESDAGTGSLLASYLQDAGGLLSERAAGATTYEYFNGHGDLLQQADASGNAVYPSARSYDEFGILQTVAPTPWGWTGRQQRDTSPLTGIVRMGVRLYDPTLGRFLSVDPIEGGSLNDYDYAGGDPVNGYDLDGRLCIHIPFRRDNCRSFARSIGRAAVVVKRRTNLNLNVGFWNIGWTGKGGWYSGRGLGVPGLSATWQLTGYPPDRGWGFTSCYYVCVGGFRDYGRHQGAYSGYVGAGTFGVGVFQSCRGPFRWSC